MDFIGFDLGKVASQVCIITGSAQFPPTSFAGEQLAIVDSVIGALETHASAQSSGKGTVRESTTSKAVARDELMRDLEAISRTARGMGQTMSGLADKFRIPHNQSNQTVLAVARAAATDALPLKAEFIKRSSLRERVRKSPPPPPLIGRLSAG